MQEHHKSHSLLRCRSLHCGLMQVLCDSRTFRHCRSSMRAVLCSIQLCARERTGSLLVTRLCHVESNCPFILSSHSSKEEILELIVDRTRSSKPANPCGVGCVSRRTCVPLKFISRRVASVASTRKKSFVHVGQFSERHSPTMTRSSTQLEGMKILHKASRHEVVSGGALVCRLLDTHVAPPDTQTSQSVHT